ITPALLEKIEALFGSFEKKESPKKYELPVFTSGYSLKNKETEQGHLCLGFPGLSLNDPDIYSFTVLNNIIGGSMSSRLFQEIREQRGLAYSIFSYHSAYSDHGTLAIYGGTSDEQMSEMQQVIMTMLKELKNGGIREEEVTDSKDQLKGSLMLGLESTSARMSRIGRHELLLGKHQTYDEVLSQIDQVTLEKVYSLLEILVESPAVSIIRPKEASLV